MNTTRTGEIDTGIDALWLYVVYIIEGGVIAGFNFVTVVAVWRQDALRHRKEYSIITGKLLADGMLGLAYMMMGIQWPILLITRQHNVPVHPTDCLYKPHFCLMIVSGPMMICMDLLTSLDRLFAVSAPFLYFNQSRVYALCSVGLVIIGCVLMGTILPITLIATNQTITEVLAICDPSSVLSVVNRFLLWWYRDFSLICQIITFALYVPIVLVYWKKSANTAQNLQKQRRLTKSLMFSALVTFLTFTVPIYLGIMLALMKWITLAMICFAFSNLDMLFNVIILLKRQPEIRKAIKALHGWKELPPNLENWQLAGRKRRNRNQNKVSPAENL